MKAGSTIRTRQAEAGIALLISIFILLLISVVAIALIVSSGTESALAGNYRSSTSVYYAALAGLEEARARLVSKNPDSFKNTDPTFLPPPGTALAVCSPLYVINLVGGETVTPWDSTSTYADKEFGPEFLSSGCSMPSSPPIANSIWKRSPLNTLSFPGPLYKWVRINAVSEQSLNLDVYPYDATKSLTTPVFYDGTRLNDTNTGSQVLEITALAVLPNGSQKLLQYLAAPLSLNLSFPASLTLDGNNVQFCATSASSFWVKGIDQGSVGSCNPGAAVVSAVGYTNSGDSSQSNIVSAIPSASPDLRNHYTNGTAPPPPPPPPANVNLVTVSPNLQTIAGLNALVQTITQSADAVVNGPATQSDLINIMPAGMSATNPMTVVVNGNLTINGWHGTGYGLLLVTGQFTYDPNANWNGIILVIGTGTMYSYQGGAGLFQGAVLLAKTVDASNIPLPLGSPLGPPYFHYTSSASGNGIAYSSCWIQAAIPTQGYKILSFHEISQ